MEGLSIPYQELQFSAVRSSGPGGQHVNKTSSAVIVAWDFLSSSVLSDKQKAILQQRLGRRLSKDGFLQLRCEEFRDQSSNKQEAIRKLHTMVRIALTPVKIRRSTKPTRGSVRRRQAAKQQRSEIKKWRQKPGES